MSHISTLQALGLSKDESATYLALLKIGGANATALATEVGVKRTTIYPILSSLREKGFASTYFYRNKRLYRAEKPDRVAGIFEKKLESFTSIIPELKTLEKQKIMPFGLRFIESRVELEKFYYGVLNEYKNKSYRIIGSSTAWMSIDPDFFAQFRVLRAHARIKTRLLISADSTASSPDDPKLLRDVRVLSPQQKFKSTIDIFDDKFIIITPNPNILAIVIEVPAMVDVFQSMFDLLWENTKN